MIKCCLLDIDECSAGTHGCSQVCTNTPGSFQCSCSSCGYQLLPDGKTCTGENQRIVHNEYLVVGAFSINLQ